MGFLLVFIVPRFEAIFHDMLSQKPLPGITLFVIGISNIAKDNLADSNGPLIALIMGIKVLGRTPGGRGLIDQFFLRLPLLGDLNSQNRDFAFRTHSRHPWSRAAFPFYRP